MILRMLGLLLRPVWLPQPLYRGMPMWCLLIGALGLLLPVGWLTVPVITYLFAYGAWVLYERAMNQMIGRY
ncbi:MAG: hypothetical protein KQH59_18295 [Desulfobulbaceae bacterium]|nr:hypothetical protein [Desulfobulbaceae bacterium]